MGLGRSAAVVIGSFPLGESDRVVTFFSRDFGRLRGVAKAARRLKSRFGGSLELFTLGQLVFFDTGRSELVRIDHFDVTRPFASVREDLGRLGEAAWMVEIVARTTGERDRQPALYGLLVRALRAMEETAAAAARGGRASASAAWICSATGPGSTAASSVGARTRFRGRPSTRAAWSCEHVPAGRPGVGAVPVSPATLAAFDRLRAVRWEEARGHADRPGGTGAAIAARHPAGPRSSASPREAAAFCGR